MTCGALELSLPSLLGRSIPIDPVSPRARSLSAGTDWHTSWDSSRGVRGVPADQALGGGTDRRRHRLNLMLARSSRVLIGARLFYVLVYGADTTGENPSRFSRSGTAAWPGTAGSSESDHCGCDLRSRVARCRSLSCGYGRGRGAASGIFFGRIANFINGELWGRTTDVSWGVVFAVQQARPQAPFAALRGAARGSRDVSRAAVGLARSGVPTGSFFGMFMLLYGVFRLIIEFFREPDAQSASCSALRRWVPAAVGATRRLRAGDGLVVP